MNCIKCGMEIPDGARFCNFCGVKQELTCASCGAVLPNGARFCHMCGNPVKSEMDPEPLSDPYADLDPYAPLYEQESAPKEAVSEEAENPDEWGTPEEWKAFGEWKGFGEPEESAPKEETVSEEVESPGEWEDFGDWDDTEASEESEEAAEEAPFDDALFDELAEEPVEEQEPLPNAQNFGKLFQIIGRTSHAHRQYNWKTKENDGPWRLRVELRYNDTYRENTDPDYWCYGCFTIIRKDPRYHHNCDPEHGYYLSEYQYGGYAGRVRSVPAFHGLEDLMAYALSDSGIYYVTKDGKICFLDSEDGSTQMLGTQEKVISLKYDAGVLTVIYVKNRRQYEHNEHYDECGGLAEAWYDGYELDVGEFDIQHPDDWMLD